MENRATIGRSAEKVALVGFIGFCFLGAHVTHVRFAKRITKQWPGFACRAAAPPPTTLLNNYLFECDELGYIFMKDFTFLT